MSKLNSPIHPQFHPTNKPSSHFKFIKTGKPCINRSHSPLQSHFNQENLWRWMHCHIWKTQSRFNKTQWKYYWRLLVSNEQIMELPITWSIPSQTTIQHDNTQLKKHQDTSKHRCQHIKTMALSHPRTYHPTFQWDLSIFYHQIICYPQKWTLLQEINGGSF